MINALAAQDVEVVTSDDAMVHTSGHPRQEELRQFYDWVKPRVLVPMHGEMIHLKRHLAFARACGVPQAELVLAGDMLRLAPGPAAVVDRVHAGRLHVDGRLIVPVADGPARFRRKLSVVGLIAVSLVLDERGSLAADPRVALDGLPSVTLDGDDFEDAVYDLVEQSFDGLPRTRRRDDAALAEAIRNAVRRGVEAEWGKRPVVHVLIHRL